MTILHGPVIKLNISNAILWIYIILKMLVQYDTMNELIVLTGQCVTYIYGPMMLNLIAHFKGKLPYGMLSVVF